MTATAASTEVQPWVQAVEEAAEKFNAIAIPDGNIVRFQSEAMFAMQRIGADQALQKCVLASIRNALINVASVGLTLNPAMKLAYLVPRRDNKAGTMLCCLDISYIGLCNIATDSGGVLAVSATVVRENDAFTWNGEFEKPTHIYDPFADKKTRGEMRGVYSTALLPNGTVKIDTLSMEEIAKIRAMSQASSSPAWENWFEEMCKKSVLKRASKLWPRTERLSKAEAILNEHQGIDIDGATGTVIDPVAMPQSRSAPAQAADEKAAGGGSHADEKKASGNTKPMSPSQGRLIAGKLERAGLTLVDLQAKFPGKGIDMEKLKEGETIFLMEEVNGVLAWISENAKT